MAAGNRHQPSAFFDRTGGQIVRLMAYSLLAIVLMAIDQKGHYGSRVRAAVSMLAVPFYSAIEWPFAVGRSVREQTRNQQQLLAENRALQEALAKANGQLLSMADIQSENRRLRELLGSSSNLRAEFQFAELIRVDLDPFSHQVVINKGHLDGVTDGQPVIDGSGVIGQVETVLPGQATIRLISDPDHALPVQVVRSGLRTIAYGTGDTQVLLLPNVSINADIKSGDRIITSGLGDRFPAGYPVAEIMSVQRRPGQTFAKVFARPYGALDRGREVLLLDVRSDGEDSGPVSPEQGGQ